MSLYDERKKEFKETILKIGNLPKLWTTRFNDREDQRLWFDTIIKVPEFQDFIKEVEELLAKFGKRLISDKEKESIFLTVVEDNQRIPKKDEFIFDDNSDMYTWYIHYVNKNRDYEQTVYNRLPEYINLDLAELWSDIKDEFIYDIKKLKRIPNHGEAKLDRSIDLRMIFAKLETFDPEYFEKIKLHLATYKTNHLTPEQRRDEFIEFVRINKYIPYLQEQPFSDGCDMFVWYLRYKDKMLDLENIVNKLIEKESPIKKVNIYLIPNFRKSGGNFYTICSNTGEVLDLSEATSFEEAKKLDPTLTKKGGLILKKDEEIGEINYGRRKK